MNPKHEVSLSVTAKILFKGGGSVLDTPPYSQEEMNARVSTLLTKAMQSASVDGSADSFVPECDVFVEMLQDYYNTKAVLAEVLSAVPAIATLLELGREVSKSVYTPQASQYLVLLADLEKAGVVNLDLSQYPKALTTGGG